MITIPTVLVFGAGVSRPFGYPLGIELRSRVIANLEPAKPLYGELTALGFADSVINGFRKAFQNSGKESVDAFLEHRTDFLDVGKVAIAQELIRYESLEKLFENKAGANLYFYLYRQFNATPEEFKDNRIAVLTYNYDRSFEHFLFNALKYSYRLSDEKTAQLIEHIPIIHLHGHLGLLPWQGDGGRKYSSRRNLAELRSASTDIRIIHEKIDVDKEPQFQKAHRSIFDASRVIFLGFGYDKANLERLRLPAGSTTTRIFGSCYGLTENERVNMNVKLFGGQATLGETQLDALNVLRNCLSLT